jgi:ankyrin repeat protein
VITTILAQDQRLINATNVNGDTPLHRTCVRLTAQALSVLLRVARPDLNVANHNHETPLFVAVRTRRRAQAQVLPSSSRAEQ